MSLIEKLFIGLDVHLNTPAMDIKDRLEKLMNRARLLGLKPQDMTLKQIQDAIKSSECRAVQKSDQMTCECGLTWDVNDCDPPECILITKPEWFK